MNCMKSKKTECQPVKQRSEHDAVPSPEVFINERELLRRLPVSRRTLFSWRDTGKIPFIRVNGGRRVVFHFPSVEAALLRQQRGGGE